MSNKTQLQTNNTALDALITRVNAAKDVAASLPEAGSGGSSGGSVETCFLNVVAGSMAKFAYTSIDENNLITTVTKEGLAMLSNATAVCNSHFVVYGASIDYLLTPIINQGCTLIYAGNGIIVAKITAVAGETARVIVNLT
jgi:hypothetical protein